MDVERNAVHRKIYCNLIPIPTSQSKQFSISFLYMKNFNFDFLSIHKITILNFCLHFFRHPRRATYGGVPKNAQEKKFRDWYIFRIIRGVLKNPFFVFGIL